MLFDEWFTVNFVISLNGVLESSALHSEQCKMTGIEKENWHQPRDRTEIEASNQIAVRAEFVGNKLFLFRVRINSSQKCIRARRLARVTRSCFQLIML